MERTGKILWQDLTVDDASAIKDFYCAVVGWKSEEVKVEDHHDYNIIDPQTNEVVAGICHRAGSISKFPPQWINYVMVEDINVSIDICNKLGGKILDGPKLMGGSQFVLIQDPAGAYFGLMSE